MSTDQLRRLRNIMVKTTTTRYTFVENQIWMSPFSAVSLTVSSRCFHNFWEKWDPNDTMHELRCCEKQTTVSDGSQENLECSVEDNF